MVTVGPAVDLLDQSDPVDRVDHLHTGKRLLHLVRLQVPDQMPTEGEIAEQRLLRHDLLHAILADVAHAAFPGFPDALDRHGLGHRDECDLARIAARAPAGPGELLL